MYKPGTLKVRNSQFLNNSFTHPNSGGVFFAASNGGVGQFTNNSISGNTATIQNKGLDASGVSTLTNNAVAGNTSTANPSFDFWSGAPTQLTLNDNHFQTVNIFNGAPDSETGTTTGAPAWTDCLCIPKDAAHKENAYKFLEYMLQPEVMAKCTNFTNYANGNAASKKFVDPAVLNDPAVYPTEDIIKLLWAPKPFNEEQDREMTRAWQQIKTG